jgi:hypothetical protein
MTRRTSVKDQDTRMEDAIDFLRKSALVEEIDGEATLTSKGEKFLQELKESSSRSEGFDSPDDPSSSEETVSR